MNSDKEESRYDVVVPRLHGNATSYKIVAWLREEGDIVKRGDSLLILETDKATIELEAEGPGVLRQIVVQAGEWVPVHAPVAVIVLPTPEG